MSGKLFYDIESDNPLRMQICIGGPPTLHREEISLKKKKKSHVNNWSGWPSGFPNYHSLKISVWWLSKKGKMVRTCIWIRKLEADILELGSFKQILILLGRCHQSEHSQVLGECGRDGGKRGAQCGVSLSLASTGPDPQPPKQCALESQPASLLKQGLF